jgi:hypothetical protein
MSEFKISNELKTRILEIVEREAQWYWECSGTQSEHHSDLSLTELSIEEKDENRVVALIVDAVLDYIGSKDTLTYQVKRIADRLETMWV